MDRRVVETALRERIPFEIETAGGSKIRVSDARNAILRPTYLVVVDDADDCPHVVPLITLAGLKYLPKAG